MVSHPGSNIPIQSTSIWSVHSTHGVHFSGQRSHTDGLTGYKDPPITRRLVGQSQILPNLSPAYLNSSSYLSGPRLASQLGEIRTSFQLRRLPVRLKGGQGQTHSRALTDPNIKNMRLSDQTDLSCLAADVPNKAADRYTKSPSGPVTHEAHTVALEKLLEGTRITKKGDPHPQITAPALISPRSTITPTKTISADLYTRIKRRMGQSLK